MGFELPDGKTARNLQDQVKFLSEKLKDLYAAFNDSGLKKIVIVEELPEVGDPTVLYLLAKEDPEEGDYYDEYLWYDNQWEQIGTTQIDLSDYCTLSTDQTITGEKKIDNKLHFVFGTTSDWWIKNANAEVVIGTQENNAKFSITTTDTRFDTNVKPYSNNVKDLGASDRTWKDLYLSGKAYFANKWDMYGESDYNFSIRNNEQLLYTFQLSRFIPRVTNTKDLGGSDYCWKDVYFKGKISNGVNEISWGNDNELVLGASAGYEIFARGRLGGRYDNIYDLGASSRRWKDLFLAGNISDGTYSATVEALIKKARLYTHTITCSNGTLVLIGSFSVSITSQSSLSMAASSALKMEWENNTVLKIVNGTTIYYFDSSDSTIKSTTIGTFTTDYIMDY